MKYIIKEGEISILLPEGEGGGLSGEVHLIKHEGKKYVVRRCKELKKAKQYEFISKKLGKYGFLPKFLGRYGKDVLYEYIEGRDLRKDEKLDVFRQLGAIAAKVNTVNSSYSHELRLDQQLKELVSGKYKTIGKAAMRVWKNRMAGEKFDKRRVKALLSKDEGENIKRIYFYLKKKVKPKVTYESNDLSGGNFRLSKGKVYFIDVEAIKPRWKGFGIAKCFTQWAKTPKKQQAFLKGYKSVSSVKFLNKNYMDFLYLNFYVQSLNYKVKVGREYNVELRRLKVLINKYNGMLK